MIFISILTDAFGSVQFVRTP